MPPNTSERCDGLAQADLSSILLDRLIKAVAVVAPDRRRLLYTNSRFREIFGDTWRQSLRQIIGRRAAEELGDASAVIELGPLTLRVRTARLREGTLVTADDISQQVAEQASAAREARTDPLTGLANRLALEECGARAVSRCADGVGTVAVLAVDLDRFKEINDSLGHQIGDALLRILADRLSSLAAGNDCVARLGGDEFVFLQKDAEQPGAAVHLAQQILSLLTRSFAVEGNILHIGASIGVAIAPADGTDYNELLRKADVALYCAKQEGRRSFRLFTPEMDEAREAKRCLETQLRRAVAMRELDVVYQPQLNLASGEITGFEALVRWNSPVCGQVSPAEFIPLAERLGLIGKIGDWVLHTACREAMKWPSGLRVGVNVSAAQFGGDALPMSVMLALGESGLPAGRLELEITESVLLDDDRKPLPTLYRLRELGAHISMDDFGTGYSSLSYLLSFPFEKLKIDQSFVRAGENKAAAVLSAIAALGRSLGMTTTAEGVETATQLDAVRVAGCTDMQGYFVSPPIGADRIRSFLAEWELKGRASKEVA